MQRWRIVAAAGLIGLLLAGCSRASEGDSPHSTSTPAVTATATAPPTISPVLLRLQAQFSSLNDAQQTILAIWESLANGESVQCGDYPTVPDPSSISAEGDSRYEGQAALLRRAAIDTGQAISLWQAECSSPRSAPSPDTIREARLAASSAGDALREAGQERDLDPSAAP